MKRVILGAAATAVAATAAVLVPQAVGATGSTGGSSVSINQYADFNFNGTQLDVGLQVSCTGGTGVVKVSVDQPYPESPDPLLLEPDWAKDPGAAWPLCVYEELIVHPSEN